MKKISLLICSCIISFALTAQEFVLKPGFDKNEFIELFKMSDRQFDYPEAKKNMALTAPASHQLIYRSAPMALANRWDLWIGNDKKTAVISIHGTKADAISWLENFYSPMVPAEGKIQINKDYTFDYKLAANPKAAVHLGWLLGTAYLSQDILPKLDSCYKSGIKNFIVMGHSQGGAISYLMTSYLYHLKDIGKLPKDIILKTYCSAAPKPGNLYYAYDYETQTKGGWGFNIVSTADWVPETPFSIQTVNDFNAVNPFMDAKKMIQKRKFPERFVLKTVYNRLDRNPKKALKQYQKYLGQKAYKIIKKSLPDYKQPGYYNSNNYVRAGTYIILSADEDYYAKFPDDKSDVFTHHYLKSYMYLLEKY